jgi:hypothetical protein
MDASCGILMNYDGVNVCQRSHILIVKYVALRVSAINSHLQVCQIIYNIKQNSLFSSRVPTMLLQEYLTFLSNLPCLKTYHKHDHWIGVVEYQWKNYL